MASLSNSLAITAGIVVALAVLALLVFALRRAAKKVEAALREELGPRPASSVPHQRAAEEQGLSTPPAGSRLSPRS
jgi:hypothetical protein